MVGGNRGENSGFWKYKSYYKTLSNRLIDGVRDHYYNARWLIAVLKSRDLDAYKQWVALDNQGPRLAMYMT
jgi:hypothetical protein